MYTYMCIYYLWNGMSYNRSDPNSSTCHQKNLNVTDLSNNFNSAALYHEGQWEFSKATRFVLLGKWMILGVSRCCGWVAQAHFQTLHILWRIDIITSQCRALLLIQSIMGEESCGWASCFLSSHSRDSGWKSGRDPGPGRLGKVVMERWFCLGLCESVLSRKSGLQG